MLKKKKSWQTTTAGVAGLVGVVGMAIHAQLDGDPSTVPNWEAVALAITTFIGFFVSRDNDKSSEDVGRN